MEQTLTEQVVAYHRTGEGWNELRDRIYIYVYMFPSRWTDWDEDRRSDFFLCFLPRIPGIVRRYVPEYSFETYLASSIRWYMKSYFERQAEHEHLDRWCEQRGMQETVERTGWYSGSTGPGAAGDDGTAIPFALDAEGRLADAVLRRRLLFAVILRAADIDDHRLPFLARLTGTDEDWLTGKVQESRKLLGGKMERRDRLNERRNECWYRMEGALGRASAAFDSRQRENWEKVARTWRSRHAAAGAGIRRMHMAPTHHEIGRLLDVPSGTVSSGLHFLRLTAAKAAGSPRAVRSPRTPRRAPSPSRTAAPAASRPERQSRD